MIWAMDKNNGIGLNNSIPFKDKTDMGLFKNYTINHIVLMGRKTYDSIPSAHKPLSDRINVVLTNNINKTEDKNQDQENLFYINNIKDIRQILERFPDKKLIVIGGAEIYKLAIENFTVTDLRISVFDDDYKCDVFFPFKTNDKDIRILVTSTFPGLRCRYGEQIDKFTLYHFSYANREESQYKELIQDILENGQERQDRTKTGTKSLFSKQLKFSLKNNSFPLLTLRRMFFKNIVGELLWILSGDTNAKRLSTKYNVNFWLANTSQKVIDERKLNLQVNDLGPVYGFTLRHFGASAEYKTSDTDYSGKGYDQLTELIKNLKEDPTSRRLIISLWDPPAFENAALPPCMLYFQFYVKLNVNGNDNTQHELSCITHIRSSDVILGLPQNIAYTALLTYTLAEICNYTTGELTVNIGDAHIYKDHINDNLTTMLQRESLPYCKLYIKSPQKIELDTINVENFHIENYHCHKAIKFNMSV
jgi:thymidylate synthase